MPLSGRKKSREWRPGSTGHQRGPAGMRQAAVGGASSDKPVCRGSAGVGVSGCQKGDVSSGQWAVDIRDRSVSCGQCTVIIGPWHLLLTGRSVVQYSQYSRYRYDRLKNVAHQCTSRTFRIPHLAKIMHQICTRTMTMMHLAKLPGCRAPTVKVTQWANHPCLSKSGWCKFSMEYKD